MGRTYSRYLLTGKIKSLLYHVEKGSKKLLMGKIILVHNMKIICRGMSNRKKS